MWVLGCSFAGNFILFVRCFVLLYWDLIHLAFVPSPTRSFTVQYRGKETRDIRIMAQVKLLPGHKAEVQTFVMIPLAERRSAALLKKVGST